MSQTCNSSVKIKILNPIRHLLALVGARHIVHVIRVRFKMDKKFKICIHPRCYKATTGDDGTYFENKDEFSKNSCSFAIRIITVTIYIPYYAFTMF